MTLRFTRPARGAAWECRMLHFDSCRTDRQRPLIMYEANDNRISRVEVPGFWILVAALLSGCGSIGYPLDHYEAVYSKTALQTPDPDPAALSRLDVARVNHGRYLVEIAGCAACHTDGALIGEPNAARLLAGSNLGIAYTNPLRGSFPGVAYPSNLTPDPRTGLGNWSDAQIVAAIRSGDVGSDRGHLAVMAWPLYQHMSDDDVNAVVMYLRSIPPIEHQVPARILAGTRATTPYVYFGVFRSGPALGIR